MRFNFGSWLERTGFGHGDLHAVSGDQPFPQAGPLKIRRSESLQRNFGSQ
jgi:hypothetical protein